MIRHLPRLFLILGVLCLAQVAAAAPLNEASNRAIKALRLARATHGIYAIDGNTGETLIDIEGSRPLNPASNVKMVTAAVALKELGGDYRLATSFSTDRIDRNSGTIGNLYIKGNGDPFLVTEITEEIARALIAKGLRHIAGDIVVDERFFDGRARQTSLANQQPYAAATAATALNFNSVRVLVDRAGKGYTITLDAPNDFITIVNRLKRTGGGIRLKRIPGKNRDTVVVSGGLPRRRRHFEEYVNISDPARYLGSAFKTLFIARGVPVNGGVREGSAAPGTVLLHTQPSKPLRQIVDDMNRFSNNFVAEQLVKHLGAVRFGPPGTTKKGLRLLRAYLSSLGIPERRYTLVNGSGLSRKNRMTARDLVAVLKDAYDDPAIRKDYINSLSVAGVKGTIKRRHTGPLLKGKLCGKTGTLEGVSTLSGYVPMRNGHTAIFAVFTNGPASWRTCHRLQDKIATLLAAR